MFSIRKSLVNELAKPMARAVLGLCASTLMSGTAQAYFSTLDTGEVLKPGYYRALVEPQIIVNKYEGVNLVGRFATGITDDSSAEAILGGGKVDFETGAFYKWVPFPDLEGQPAIGGKAGITYARVEGETEFSLRLHPLVSKKFQTEVGDFNAYGSIPFGLTNRDDDTFVPVQLVGGTEWKTLNWENLTFMGEIGFNLNKSFSYISGAVVYYFDESMTR